MSTYDFLASKAKRMRKRLSRSEGSYRQAYSDYSSAFDTYTTEAGEFQEAFKFREKWGDAVKTYVTGRTTDIDTEYKGTDGATGKFGAAKTDYLGKLSAAQSTFGIGESALETEYYGDPDDDTSTGKFGQALSTYTGAVEKATTKATTDMGSLNVDYYGDPDDEASTGKYGALETAYQTKVSDLQTGAVESLTKAHGKYYGTADDPKTKDIDESTPGQWGDAQTTYSESATGKYLSDISERMGIGVDLSKISDVKDLEKAGATVRDTFRTTKWRSGSGYDNRAYAKWKEFTGFGGDTKKILGGDESYIKGAGLRDPGGEGAQASAAKRILDRIGYNTNFSGDDKLLWRNNRFEREKYGTRWVKSSIPGIKTPSYGITGYDDLTDSIMAHLSSKSESLWTDKSQGFSVQELEDFIGKTTGSKQDQWGNVVKSSEKGTLQKVQGPGKAESFDSWIKRVGSNDPTGAPMSKPQAMKAYKDALRGKGPNPVEINPTYTYERSADKKNYALIGESEDWKTRSSTWSDIDEDYIKEEGNISGKLETDIGAAGTKYTTDFGVLQTNYGTESTRIENALKKVVGVMDDPDTDEDETVIGSAEKAYKASVSTLNTEFTTKLGKLTKALEGVTGTDTEKGSALTDYETKVGGLTTEYETALKNIYKESGYTAPKGKFETAKETYEREEVEYQSAYDTLFGTDTDVGAEKRFTSAKTSFDTLRADYASLAGRVKKYERLGLTGQAIRSKKFRTAKTGAGSYL